MADIGLLIRMIDANQAQQAAIRGRVGDVIERSWMSLGSWRDADVKRWSNQVIPLVAGAQQQTAALQAAYLSTIGTASAGARVAPIAVDPADVTTEALRGVSTAEVYQRPAVSTWASLSKGDTLDFAIKQGLRRALSIADTDLQLAKTHTSRRSLSGADRVVGYRRTLTGRENCGLCAVASTQRYHHEVLMPIHPGCDCGVAPIYGETDPGQVINQSRLDATHQSILDTFGTADASARDVNPNSVNPTQYRDVLVVHEHGEIGPVLGVRGQNFTGPSDL